jgi:hypothetical protein
MKGMGMIDSLSKMKEYTVALIRHKQMEDFYNKNHKQENYILYKGRIWKVGDGTGKAWDYLCSSREAQKDANEMMGLK